MQHNINNIIPGRFLKIGLGICLLLQSHAMCMAQVKDSQEKIVNQNIQPQVKLTLKMDVNLKWQPTLITLQSLNQYSLMQWGLVMTTLEVLKFPKFNDVTNQNYTISYAKQKKEIAINNPVQLFNISDFQLKLLTLPEATEPKISLFLNLPKNNIPLIQLKQQKFVVLRLKERRVYIYQSGNILANYPVAVGKEKWETPTGNFKVMEMLKNPGWTNFKTGKLVSPGKENPLGERWIAFWTDSKDYIGFHGTPDRASVGQAISHGCVRMYNEDIRELYKMVNIGTPVIVEP